MDHEVSSRDILERISADVTTIITGTSSVRYSSSHPTTTEIDQQVAFSVTLLDPFGSIVPTTSITPGTYTIHRLRSGVDTEVVASTPSSEAAGRVYTEYTFPDADWDIDDICYVLFEDIVVTTTTDTYYYPDIYMWCRVTDQSVTNTLVNEVLKELSSATYGLEAIKNAVDTIDVNVDTTELATQSLVTAEHDDTDALITALDGKVDTVDTNVDAILVDTGTTIPATLTTIEGKIDTVDTVVDGIASALSTHDTTVDGRFDTVDSTLAALNDISTAEVNTEVDSALNTQVPSSPTAGSLNDILSASTGNTYDRTTDSLEAISNRVASLNDYQARILNDSFESGVGNWTAESGVTLTSETTTYRRGSKSMKLVSSTSNKGVYSTISGARAVAGEYWVQVHMSAPVNCNAEVYLSDGTTFDKIIDANVYDWKVYSAHGYFSGSTAGDLRVYIRFGTLTGATTLYVDDVQVVDTRADVILSNLPEHVFSDINPLNIANSWPSYTLTGSLNNLETFSAVRRPFELIGVWFYGESIASTATGYTKIQASPDQTGVYLTANAAITDGNLTYLRPTTYSSVVIPEAGSVTIQANGTSGDEVQWCMVGRYLKDYSYNV